jgi:hypothetical protein
VAVSDFDERIETPKPPDNSNHPVTDAMHAALAVIDEPIDEFIHAAARLTLARAEWLRSPETPGAYDCMSTNISASRS